MTCREKLKIEHPDLVYSDAWGGCEGCPSAYDYLLDPLSCTASPAECAKCWDREIPGTEPSTPQEDVVNHPNHYTNGGMECIDEMILIFGIEATMHFCLLNAWKYRRRAPYKNGEEDIQKSHWYIAKYKELKALVDGKDANI